jgi:thiamine pyrophosphate-dependent enzyme
VIINKSGRFSHSRNKKSKKYFSIREQPVLFRTFSSLQIMQRPAETNFASQTFCSRSLSPRRKQRRGLRHRTEQDQEGELSMAKTAADVMIEGLIDWGVDTVFGIPGDGINGIMESLRTHQKQVRFIQTRHEEAVAFMA